MGKFHDSRLERKKKKLCNTRIADPIPNCKAKLARPKVLVLITVINIINININKGKKEIKLTDQLFERLMGKKPEFRFKFIKDNANFIRQVDI